MSEMTEAQWQDIRETSLRTLREAVCPEAFAVDDGKLMGKLIDARIEMFRFPENKVGHLVAAESHRIAREILVHRFGEEKGAEIAQYADTTVALKVGYMVDYDRTTDAVVDKLSRGW